MLGVVSSLPYECGAGVIVWSDAVLGDLELFDFLFQLELHGYPSPLTRLTWLDSEIGLSLFL